MQTQPSPIVLLVPLDGSEAAVRALRHAMQVAGRDGNVRLHLLTVHPEPIVYGEVQVYMGREKAAAAATSHDAAVLRAAEAALQGSGVAYVAEALEGNAAEVITRRAAELGCEQIIMGTRGLGRVGAMLLGSVTTAVIQNAPCPVTLIR
jgi:nucleotide-binding universal stress UspA family protein